MSASIQSGSRSFQETLDFINNFDSENQIMNDRLQGEAPVSWLTYYVTRIIDVVFMRGDSFAHLRPAAVFAQYEHFLSENHKKVCENLNAARDTTTHFRAIYQKQQGPQKAELIFNTHIVPLCQKINAWEPRWQDYVNSKETLTPAMVNALSPQFNSLREAAEKADSNALPMLDHLADIQANYYLKNRRGYAVYALLNPTTQLQVKKLLYNIDYAPFVNNPSQYGYYQLFLYHLNKNDIQQAENNLYYAMSLTGFTHINELKDKRPVGMSKEKYKEWIAGIITNATNFIENTSFDPPSDFEELVKKDQRDYEMIAALESALRALKTWA